jgi:hypothetical protein
LKRKLWTQTSTFGCHRKRKKAHAAALRIGKKCRFFAGELALREFKSILGWISDAIGAFCQALSPMQEKRNGEA